MKQIQLKLTIDKDIELLEEWIKEDKQFTAKYKLDKFFIPTKGQKRLKAVENLINKYKKLREVMHENRDRYHKYMKNADETVFKLQDKITLLEDENTELKNKYAIANTDSIARLDQLIIEREKTEKQERIIKEMAKYVDIRRFNSR